MFGCFFHFCLELWAIVGLEILDLQLVVATEAVVAMRNVGVGILGLQLVVATEAVVAMRTVVLFLG